VCARLGYALLHVRDSYNLKSHKNTELQQQSAAHFAKWMINIYCFWAGHCFYFTFVLFLRKTVQLDWNRATGGNNQSSFSVAPWAKSNPISSHLTFPSFSKLTNP
jgi:hypothetical protein